MRTGFEAFCAWRYSTQRVSLDDVIAPPYDVISPAMQEDLYRLSPHNCIRLILNRHEKGDHDGYNRYTRARDYFQSWRAEGILVQDERPCYYLYQQRFNDPRYGRSHRRSAFLGLLKLEPFEKGVVVPHEKTLSAPKVDRRKLLETAKTNFSPIFGLFEDPEKKLVSLTAEIAGQAPLFEASDVQGVGHRLWKIEDLNWIRTIRETLSRKKIYIADGHHRYQTALDYSLEQRAKLGVPEGREIPSDYVYAALVAFEDPGIVIFPTHRLVLPFAGFEPEKMISLLSPFFEVQSVRPGDLTARLEAADAKAIVLGLVFDESRGFLLRLKDLKAAQDQMPAGKPEVWYHLDVNLLAFLILKSIWQLPETEWEAHLQYTHSDQEALKAIGERRVAAAFMLRSPKIQVLAEMGKVKELMPQKSTYFYPKLASGLLFYPHETQAAVSSTR